MFNGFNQAPAAAVLNQSSESALDRRRFLSVAAVTGFGVASVGVVGATAGTAFAGAEAELGGPSDTALLNVALNLAYLEAEFFLRGAFGTGLEIAQIGGTGTVGEVRGGRKVEFATATTRQQVEEIADDERAHVAALRAALGSGRVSRPRIDLDAGFSALAALAGLVRPNETFDVFAGEDTFLLGAFVLADLAVTAYRGVLPLVANRPSVELASGILAAEAYHAGLVRSWLLARRLEVPAGALSDARDCFCGGRNLDQGIVDDSGRANIVPTDASGTVAARSPGEVLNVLYLSPRAAGSGGFFPAGVNGEITTSG